MAAQYQTQVPTILVADDDDETRELLARILRVQGYRVISASDGLQALEAFSKQPIDLALIDVLMPIRSGFRVCRELKSCPETRLIPVVLVTGLASTDDRIQGIECGADDFLSKPIRKEELLARVRSLVRLKRFTDELESAEAVLFSLARSIEAKDQYLQGHSDRLAGVCFAMAERLGLSEGEQVALRRGGIVHDIGKVVIPDHILRKPGPLDPAERRMVESHPVVGEHICAPLKSFRQVLPIIRWHHEKGDGSGYPDGLRGNHIPLTVRILQVADVFDALTSNRPYRRALATRQALAILREEARHGWWDGALVAELESLVLSAVPVVSCKAVSWKLPLASPAKTDF